MVDHEQEWVADLSSNLQVFKQVMEKALEAPATTEANTEDAPTCADDECEVPKK